MKRKPAKHRSAPASDSPDAIAADRSESLAQRFAAFADEARVYAGPLYETLSRAIARDAELLDVARHVRRPPVPNVLFAAVHFLLAESPGPAKAGHYPPDTPSHELAAFYGSLCEKPRPPAEAWEPFRDFVRSNRARLIPLLESRITQTNEVGRCSFLLPSFEFVYERAGRRPLAIIDVGCSAGLHLRWDRYHYDYGVLQAGDPHAAVSIVCELSGPSLPPVPKQFPECPSRLGIDLNPLDLRDPVERRWFEALIWPEHARRRATAAAAIDELLRDPQTIVKGDAVDLLASHLSDAPADETLLVYNSAALCQGGEGDERSLARVMTAHSFHRPIFWLHCENEEVKLRVVHGGRIDETKLANKDGHGRWLEWLV